MIRQAISCDICGAEKRQTNHWFVAYSHGGELRVTGWNASGRMRAGCKHLERRLAETRPDLLPREAVDQLLRGRADAVEHSAAK